MYEKEVPLTYTVQRISPGILHSDNEWTQGVLDPISSASNLLVAPDGCEQPDGDAMTNPNTRSNPVAVLIDTPQFPRPP